MLDSSVVLPARLASGLRFPGRWPFVAPALLWSEVPSALHEARWRGQLDDAEATSARSVFHRLPIHRDEPEGFADESWRVADELGLAKTHDAEFIALARLRATRLVTADARLLRAARRTGLVVGPTEIG